MWCVRTEWFLVQVTRVKCVKPHKLVNVSINDLKSEICKLELATLPNLKSLHLRHLSFPRGQNAEVPKAVSLAIPSLCRLTLTSCRITDQFVITLMSLRDFEHLDLSYNSITAQGANVIAQAIATPRGSLRILNLNLAGAHSYHCAS